ncbi:uncharacterized protein LOC143921346 [Arctopsyche grandis]|uniref:uncharacterized protein LOC143921346 n=1 Tax=Arctopsyche grandis TaxID=121162 RepID=UPI00406D9A45
MGSFNFKSIYCLTMIMLLLHAACSWHSKNRTRTIPGFTLFNVEDIKSNFDNSQSHRLTKRCIVVQKQSGTHGDSSEGGTGQDDYDYDLNEKNQRKSNRKSRRNKKNTKPTKAPEPWNDSE